MRVFRKLSIVRKRHQLPKVWIFFMDLLMMFKKLINLFAGNSDSFHESKGLSNVV
jgi:hypothetical protein